MLSKTTLALATCMALTACKPAHDQATAPQAATPAAATSAAAPALDINELDTRADACQDLNAFANGKALAKGIPDDEVGIGTSYDVYNASYRDQHAIAEALLKA
ncbi:hypothetical protein LMG919_19520, partial [Xanthomonas vesicatoria]